LKRCD